MNYDGYCDENGGYSIYNIYFDNETNDIIRHSTSKPYFKEKLRLRTYIDPKSDEEKAFLELKFKVGGIVYKRRSSMTLKQAYHFVETGEAPESDSYLKSMVEDEIKNFINFYHPKPAVYIKYDRTAFFGKEDKEFRLTVDDNIITRRDDLRLESGVHGENLLGEGLVLMEVKIENAVPLWLASALSSVGAYRTSFSKYGNEYKKFVEGNKNYA